MHSVHGGETMPWQVKTDREEGEGVEFEAL